MSGLISDDAATLDLSQTGIELERRLLFRLEIASISAAIRKAIAKATSKTTVSLQLFRMSKFIASLVAANRDLLPTNSTSEQGQCDNQLAYSIELAFFLLMLACLLLFFKLLALS